MANVEKKDGSSKKVLLIVILVFFGVALFALGIFLGTMLSNKKQLVGGGIEVGDMSGSPFTFDSFTMDDVKLSEGQVLETGFVLDAAKDDEQGRFKWDGKRGEKMQVIVSGSITNAELLGVFSYTLQLPAGVIVAAQEGYLDISEYFDMETGTPIVHTLDTDEWGKKISYDGGQTLVWEFEFELNLRWGSRFAGKNPSIYFDEEGAGETMETALEVLNDLHDTIMTEEHPRFTLYMTAEQR